MKIQDKGNMLFKCFRDETPEVQEDRKNTQVGVRVIDQDENDSNYEFNSGGDECCWLYWDNIATNNIDIEFSEHSRNIVRKGYFSNTIVEPTEIRSQGFWSQCVPAVMRKNGLSPIVGESYNPNVAIKKINDEDVLYGSTTVHNILGYNIPFGAPGFLTSTSEQNREEQYFIPSGGFLSVDHKAGGMSTRVFDVGDDGYISDVGALDTIFRINKNSTGLPVLGLNCSKSEFDSIGYGSLCWKVGSQKFTNYLSYEKGGILHPGNSEDRHKTGSSEDGTVENVAHIWTEANFWMDKNKDGALTFEHYTAPGITPPAEPEYYLPAYCAFDTTTNKWRWVVPMTSGEEIIVIARVAWNVSGGVDKSEAQAVSYINGAYQPQPAFYWVDYEKSLGVDFLTAGDNAIFRMKLVQKELVRNGVTRDLYRVTHCVYDKGLNITHIKKSSYLNNNLYGFLLSDDNLYPAWADEANKIKTTINNVTKDNIIRIKIPEQWKLDAGNEFLELMTYGEGLSSVFRPIRPTLFDPDLLQSFESLEKINDISIAQYKLLS